MDGQQGLHDGPRGHVQARRHQAAVSVCTKCKPLSAAELEAEGKKDSFEYRKVKARLTTRGHRDKHKATKETETVTAGQIAHRVVSHTATQQRWPIVGLDVGGAFFKTGDFDPGDWRLGVTGDSAAR